MATALGTPARRRLLHCCLLLALVACKKGDGCGDDSEASRAMVRRFVQAWVDESYNELWALATPSYRQRVDAARFAEWMREHPFIGEVKSGKLEPVGNSYHVGELNTARGLVRVRLQAYERDDVWRIADAETWPGKIDLLPPSFEPMPRAHEFLRALVHRRWQDAWRLTHPSYRAQVDSATFAEAFRANVWLLEARGFEVGQHDGDLAGQILLLEGDVKVALHFGRAGGEQWITEVVIGGTPSLPKPGRPGVVYEATE